MSPFWEWVTRWLKMIFTPLLLHLMLSTAISMSVCLSAHFISKTICLCPNFTKFSVHVTCDRGLVLLCNTLCTSGFVDDVMFSHNGTQWYRWGVRPRDVSQREATQTGAELKRWTALAVKANSALCTGAKSAILNCLVVAVADYITLHYIT